MSIAFTYLAVFLSALILIDALLRLFFNALERRKFVNYRMKLLEGDVDRKIVYEKLLKQRGVAYGRRSGVVQELRRIITQANLNVSVTRWIAYATAGVFAIFAAGRALGFASGATLIVAVPLVALIMFGFVLRRRSRRIRVFTEQLPDALDVIIRSLGAGHPLPTSVALVAREMPDPIGTEFGIMSDEMTYGTEIDGATRNMVERVGAEDLSLLAVSLSVQRGSGGNLTEILANLSDMIRKRTMMKAKIKAISAEGRMTSWFMLVFPFFLYFLILALAPDYFEPVYESGYANIIFIVGFVIMIIGMLILRKIVNFDY